jgi:hypothetical protein
VLPFEANTALRLAFPYFVVELFFELMAGRAAHGRAVASPWIVLSRTRDLRFWTKSKGCCD